MAVMAQIKVGVEINCSQASHDLRDTLWRLARVWQAKRIGNNDYKDDTYISIEKAESA